MPNKHHVFQILEKNDIGDIINMRGQIDGRVSTVQAIFICFDMKTRTTYHVFQTLGVNTTHTGHKSQVTHTSGGQNKNSARQHPEPEESAAIGQHDQGKL